MTCNHFAVIYKSKAESLFTSLPPFIIIEDLRIYRVFFTLFGWLSTIFLLNIKFLIGFSTNQNVREYFVADLYLIGRTVCILRFDHIRLRNLV